MMARASMNERFLPQIDPAPVAATPTGQPIFDVANERQRDVLQRLEQGTEAILSSDGFAAYLRMVGRFHAYSFQNTILIMAQKPESTLVNAYGRWRDLGRQVK